MSLKKRIFALLLAAVMLFSVSGCGLVSLDSFANTLIDATRNGATKFGDMEYVRPEEDDIRASVDGICDMLDEGKGYDDVASALDEFYSLYWSFYTMYTLAEIRSDLDTTDEYYAGEYEYCSGIEADVSTMFTELMVYCADSSLASELDEGYFGGMLAESYSQGYDDGFEVLNSLYAKESTLLTAYREALVEFYSYDDYDEGYKDLNPEVCQIYIDLVKVRRDIAEECGYSSYEELSFAQYGREYSPEDAEEYLSAVKEYIVPLYKEAAESEIITDAYYNLGESSPEESLRTVGDAVVAMDDSFKNAINFMSKWDLYDIGGGDEKLETSYVIYIDDYNSPFMFVKTYGYEEDILSIAHEFGHFTDSYVNYDMNYNLDTSETLSQGLEYLTLCYIDDSSLAERLATYKMTDTLCLHVNQACFYEFEHRVFALSDSELTVSKVNSIYAECALEYGFGEGYGDILGLSWIDINHVFDYPFYVISYCVSDAAAFNIYCMELESSGDGLAAYLTVLQDAANLDFIELLDSAGISSPLSEENIKNIAGVIESTLGL